MKKFNDDTFLARWLNNELSSNEKAEFEASEDYKIYERIIAGASLLEAPQNYDSDQMLETILASKKKSVDRGTRYWVLGIAASIAILVMAYFAFDQLTEVHYTAQNGHKNSFELPDGSQVLLNAGSEISYEKWSWADDRKIHLNGEAFFDVVKGNTFRVQTHLGMVTVLGTEFNVKVSGEYFEVACYEGSVSVRTKTDSTILKAFEGFRQIKTQSKSLTVRLPEPSWINNESHFDNIPAEYVIEELEKQYNLLVRGQLPPGKMFTGSFPHDDQETALKIVLDALQIKL